MSAPIYGPFPGDPHHPDPDAAGRALLEEMKRPIERGAITITVPFVVRETGFDEDDTGSVSNGFDRWLTINRARREVRIAQADIGKAVLAAWPGEHVSDYGKRLAAIEGRASAATKGPWKWWTSNSHRRLTSEGGHVGGIAYGETQHDGCDNIVISDADMAFTEHAREDIPWLLAQLRAVREAFVTLGHRPCSCEAPAESVTTLGRIWKDAVGRVGRKQRQLLVLVDVVRRANNALFDVLPQMKDPEHVIACHPETLPDTYRRLAAGVKPVVDLLSAVVLEMVEHRVVLEEAVHLKPQVVATPPPDASVDEPAIGDAPESRT